jgi:hypothetical protein
MKLTICLIGTVALVGCAGGPAKDYYNPAVVGAKFKPPVTVTLSQTPKAEVDELVAQGYTLIGTSAYAGKLPESKELIAQARRVGANHVVYGGKFIPNPPGSWSFRFGPGNFGSGGSGGGVNDMYIVFLGRP